ncbi:iron chelate uptake ABC transporter family permease subunit [Mycolicibacterium sp. OfavD-34-C]|uniref:FecCD family ABC transporter permease n=1 Tax=Mycolicibacterium sp. OfavD-34-C TaxID=2917746 RepID=UPI001EF6C0C2|nr:iron chelate uptake ABC transporter family permease subunit [Mycolicibacterium sp. OfavD-34-C]MCG7579921.1 iron chelate uptake ABC transporter family permease subunit [Mycolicibacterium sp. OfavD-34-C]
MSALGRDALVLNVGRGRLSARISRTGALLTAVAWTTALSVAAISLTLGEYPITAGNALDVLAGGGTLIERDIVLNGRLPRAATGLGVGAAFALSGAVLQRIATNPLVSPDIIGINSGAALGALIVLIVLGGSGATLVLGALLGALVTAAAILLIAYQRGLQGFRLVLVGIGVAAMLSSGISYLLTRSNINEAMSAAAWLTGSLANRSTMHVTIIGVTLLIAVPVLVVLARHLRLLELGDDLARTLSGSRHGNRISLVLVAIALAAMATAAAGPIAFVALVAPQIVRRLLAERHVGLAPAAAVGALLVVTADLAARLIFAPTEIPVGILTAIFGAPVLLYLLARANRIGAAG